MHNHHGLNETCKFEFGQLMLVKLNFSGFGVQPLVSGHLSVTSKHNILSTHWSTLLVILTNRPITPRVHLKTDAIFLTIHVLQAKGFPAHDCTLYYY